MSAKNKLKHIDEELFIKTSATKKNHYSRFPTLKSYSKRSQNENKEAEQLTNEILLKEPSGDPSDKNTLLHVLNAAAKANGKQCTFYYSSKNIKPADDITENLYLNVVDGNDKEAGKFVVVLNTLDQFVEEQKYDKVDKLCELKKAMANKEDNPVIDDVRNKLAIAHGVSVNRIIIMDVYINGNAFVYKVTDLTDTEKNKIITESSQYEDKMKQLFEDYERCAISSSIITKFI